MKANAGLVIVLLLTVLALVATSAWAQAPAQPPAPAPRPRRHPRPQHRRSRAAAPRRACPPKIDSGDTAWVLMSSALVLLMTAPGLALFYGGMVRQKNALGTLMHSFIILALDLASSGCCGATRWPSAPTRAASSAGSTGSGLRGVGQTPNADYAATIPHQAFMLFQMMFAVITPALITGAFAERKKFSTFIVFILVWATLRLRPARALGVGRGRLAPQPGRAGLRGRHRRAHLLGHLGARGGARHRQAQGIRAPARCRRTTCR